MRPCRDFEPLLAERAAGALGPDAGARLAAHLEGCAACRAEGEALAEALALAALPPPAGDGELEGLSRETLRAWRARERDQRTRRRVGAGLAVAFAAAAVMVVVPALRSAHPPAPAAAAWREPDLDRLWAASALADPDAADSGSGEVAIFADDAVALADLDSN